MPEPSNKRQRIVTCCQTCRDRHLRCDDNDPCFQCVSQGVNCVRSVNVRFRSTTQDATKSFPPDQRWLSPASQIQYHDETSEIEQHYLQTVKETHAQSGTIFLYSHNRAEGTQAGMESTTTLHDNGAQASVAKHVSQGIKPIRSPTEASSDFSRRHDARSVPETSPHVIGISPSSIESPTSLDSRISYLDRRYHQQFQPFTHREADLIRNFSQNMANWADISDRMRHFEVEVPRRACFNLTIKYALCAFSSRHMNRNQEDAWTESLNYHQKCLGVLIPILSDSEQEIDEDILVAVAILRLDEEMEVHDNRFHLQGITRILSRVSNFSSKGGLGEATAWLCLRQEIHVALVSEQPLRTNVAVFEQSSFISQNDDLSWANRMVLLLAHVLNATYSNSNDHNEQQINELDEKVESWMHSKPATFAPIKYVPRDKQSQNPFPVIWLLQPFHVLGIQYYHIARIVLAVITASKRKNRTFSSSVSRTIEKQVRHHILIVVGLAVSNPKAENVLFTARHVLTVFGGILRKTADQVAVREFLQEMEKRTGWTNAKLIANLDEQWDDSENE